MIPHSGSRGILYFSTSPDDSNVTLNDEAEEYVWIDPRAALDLPLDAYTRVSIEKYLEKE
jgi:hypothetical protein